jgi:NADH-quinone oxidoreductase subunit L
MVFEAIVVIIPLLSIITSLFLEKRLYSKVSTIFTGIAFLLNLYVFLSTNKESSFIFLRFDGLGTLLASYILLVSLVIHKYSENYMTFNSVPCLSYPISQTFQSLHWLNL